ncbi:hypothetical protein A2880_02995 [Candidatus Peribacteria bacterium RIFCSPHIGHO2_01_FULL_49_38]|nr:MAG: hypothetical protein A2880_02995 [Candidatus Peribacteria bacterium RIFCSPHIGHO2_01_FULL_49_38]
MTNEIKHCGREMLKEMEEPYINTAGFHVVSGRTLAQESAESQALVRKLLEGLSSAEEPGKSTNS